MKPKHSCLALTSSVMFGRNQMDCPTVRHNGGWMMMWAHWQLTDSSKYEIIVELMWGHVSSETGSCDRKWAHSNKSASESDDENIQVWMILSMSKVHKDGKAARGPEKFVHPSFNFCYSGLKMWGSRPPSLQPPFSERTPDPSSASASLF